MDARPPGRGHYVAENAHTSAVAHNPVLTALHPVVKHTGLGRLRPDALTVLYLISSDGSHRFKQKNSLRGGKGDAVVPDDRQRTAPLNPDRPSVDLRNIVVLDHTRGVSDGDCRCLITSCADPLQFIALNDRHAVLVDGHAFVPAPVDFIGIDPAIGGIAPEERGAILGGTVAHGQIRHAVGVDAVVLQIDKATAPHQDVILPPSGAVVMGANAACHIVKPAVFHSNILRRQRCAALEGKKINVKRLLEGL